MKYKVFAFITAAVILFYACGDDKKKKNMDASEDVSVEDFIDFYPVLKLPFSYSDTSFPAKENGSLVIAGGIFEKFTQDSAVARLFIANAKPKYYAVGRFQNGEEETYLITKALANDRKILLLSAYDKNKNYIAQLPLIRVDRNLKSSVSITIDPKFNIKKDITKSLPGEILVQGHDVFILNNSSKKFMLIMTDSLGEASGELVNPIDTLPKTQKYTGDYGDGKLKLISLRDGQRQGRMHVFISLKNNQDACEGEIKGEINFISPTTAEYRQGGDPCILRFDFTNNAVKMTEVEGCGSRLGNLECSFNGTYSKRKAVKDSPEKNKGARTK